MYKDSNVVMLPTEKAHICKLIDLEDNSFEVRWQSESVLEKGKFAFLNEKSHGFHIQPQHIYITSDEEIKEGDWCYEKETNSIFQAKEITKSGIVRSEEDSYVLDACKKIIATTDSTLTHEIATNGGATSYKGYVPQIPEWFIKYWIEQYNKGNVIEKVMVEYETTMRHSGWSGGQSVFIPHTRPKLTDNTISIKEVEEKRYSLNDMLKAIKEARLPNRMLTEESTIKWIKENL